MSETLRIEKKNDVATVVMTRLAMNPVFFREIGDAFRSLSKDADLRAVVVCSEGKAFSYGLDLPAAFVEYGELFSGGQAGTRMKLLSLIRELQASMDAVAACPVPVIAAIHGWCIGGALDLIACCDVRLAAADARFSLRETRVAIVADLGSLQRLPPIIGQGATRELAFTGRDIDAAKALRIGLINDVFETREALMAAAYETAAEIAGNAPLVVRGVKDVLNFGAGKPVSDGLAYVAAWNSAFLASEDLGEAAAAFMEKRKPDFKGR
jgi:enoyl-CoA hydratase